MFSHINMRKMERVAVCYKQYLADLGKKFLLTPQAEIEGMGEYGFNSRSFENNFSRPGEDYQNDPDPSNDYIFNYDNP